MCIIIHVVKKRPYTVRQESDRFMYYISLDLEWNQAYAEQAQAVQKRLGARLRGEVIQIGAVKMDENGSFCGSYSIIVKPRYFKRIHRHVKVLTGITQDMIDAGTPLLDAAERFRRWCGEDFAFLTWGPDDIPMLSDNLRVLGGDTSWLDRVYDLQPIFNRQTDGENRQRSLEFAMEHFHILQTLPAHDALNDAYFTALVAAKLDLRAGVADYAPRRGQFLEEAEIGCADAGDIGFDTIEDALNAPDVRNPKCPLCGKEFLQLEETLHSRGQRYTRLMKCEEHGEMMVNIRLQHNYNETLRARKTVAPAEEEAVANYRRKLAEAAAQKKARTAARRRRRRPSPKSEPQEHDTEVPVSAEAQPTAAE